MKTLRIAALTASVALMSACAFVPPIEGGARRVSPDYMATGTAETVRAYVYGTRTVLEFENDPAFLAVRDEKGASVGFEKVGRHYRLERRLDNFTVWANGRSATFTAAMTTRVFSAPPRATTAKPINIEAKALKVTAIEFNKPKEGDAALLTMLKHSEKQLNELRQAVHAASLNPKATGEELFTIETRLNEIEARLLTASATVVRVQFPTLGTTFSPCKATEAALIASARAAQHINVSGYTDARKAGKMDAKIAQGRAVAAQKYLIAKGVQPEKITVASQADGSFIAPNITKQGRALNRRVEIEIVNPRIAELKTPTVSLAAK